jgi:hypothetical protein
VFYSPGIRIQSSRCLNISLLTLNDIKSLNKTFRSVFIIDPEDLSAVPTTDIVSVRLSTRNITGFRKIFIKLSGRQSAFLVSIPEDGLTHEIEALLMHSIFSPAYFRQNNLPVVYVHGEGEQQSLNGRQIVRKLLVDQGYAGLITWQRSVDIDPNQPLFIDETVATNDHWIESRLTSDLKSITGTLVFDFRNFREAKNRELLLAAACDHYLNEHPNLRAGIESYRQLELLASQLQSENTELIGRLTGAEKTIDVIRTKYKDDYENLFKWYHNEYEILPLWYKRMGHIIKVIMGKRSFRSLFSDDVKKYKN